jgi:glycosyltransferase involved in cell wall biosynthesis
MECLSRENEIISIKQINYKGTYSHRGVAYHFVRFYQKKTHLSRRLNRYIAALRPDVVVVQGLHHPLQIMQLGYILGRKVKIILHHHAEVPFTGWKKQVQAVADRFVSAYLFASYQMGLEWVEKGIISSPTKIHEVMEVSSSFSPIDKETAKLKTGVLGKAIFLWVGRLNQNKDPLTVVKTFVRYAAFNKGARLYMIYHTDELLQRIRQVLKNERAGEKVILVGKVAHDDLHYWYNSADFFIAGSHYEGSGTALCEAMSCGCIPIVTDIPSFRMITDEGHCGLLYEAGNSEELLWALDETKRPGLQQKQTRALDYFRSNLSFDAIAQKIGAIASSLV